MKSFFKYLLFLIILVIIFYGLFLYPGSIVISWLGYNAYSSIFAVAVLLLVLVVICFIIRFLKDIFYLLFSKINLSETLSKYIKRIELSNSVEKEIQLSLIDEINDLKTLRLFAYLNGLVLKKQYDKALKVVKKKEHKARLKNILNYIRVEVMLEQGLEKEATELCKVYLNSNKSATWAFLKLFDISVSGNNNDFEFLNNYLLNNHLSLSNETLERVYCLINYKLAEQEQNINSESMYKRLTLLIKRYPRFIPAYTLLVKYLTANSLREEANKFIVASWQHNITYENTILWDNLFITEDKAVFIKEVTKLIKSHKNELQDKKWLLLAIIYAAYNDFLNTHEVIINIKDTTTVFFKLVSLYLLLKENNIKGARAVIINFASGLPLNWWNEYLKLEAKPQ